MADTAENQRAKIIDITELLRKGQEESKSEIVTTRHAIQSMDNSQLFERFQDIHSMIKRMWYRQHQKVYMPNYINYQQIINKSLIERLI